MKAEQLAALWVFYLAWLLDWLKYKVQEITFIFQRNVAKTQLKLEVGKGKYYSDYGSKLKRYKCNYSLKNIFSTLETPEGFSWIKWIKYFCFINNLDWKCLRKHSKKNCFYSHFQGTLMYKKVCTIFIWWALSFWLRFGLTNQFGTKKYIQTVVES